MTRTRRSSGPMPKLRTVVRSQAFVLAWLALACSDGGQIDLGGNAVEPRKDGSERWLGAWDGNVEGVVFTTGSDRLRLVVSALSVATLELGDMDLPPMEREVGYPRIINPQPDMYETPYYFEGFEYPVRGLRLEESRLRGEVERTDAQAGWCTLQEPHPNPMPMPNEPDYLCNVREFIQVEHDCWWADSMAPVDCQWVVTCNGVCECSQSECHTHPLSFVMTPFKIDARLNKDGDELNGTLVHLNDTGETIEFSMQRQ